MATAAAGPPPLPHPRDYRVHQEMRVCDFQPEGDVLVRANDYPGAIASYDQQLARSPGLGDREKAVLLANRGYAKYRQVDFFPAIDDFSAAIAHDAALPVAWFNRGQVYYRLSHFQEAVADFHQALELKPDFRECQRFLDAAQRDLEKQFGAR